MEKLTECLEDELYAELYAVYNLLLKALVQHYTTKNVTCFLEPRGLQTMVHSSSPSLEAAYRIEIK